MALRQVPSGNPSHPETARAGSVRRTGQPTPAALQAGPLRAWSLDARSARWRVRIRATAPGRPFDLPVPVPGEVAVTPRVDVQARRTRRQPALGVAAGAQPECRLVADHAAQRALDHASTRRVGAPPASRSATRCRRPREPASRRRAPRLRPSDRPAARTSSPARRPGTRPPGGSTAGRHRWRAGRERAGWSRQWPTRGRESTDARLDCARTRVVIVADGRPGQAVARSRV